MNVQMIRGLKAKQIPGLGLEKLMKDYPEINERLLGFFRFAPSLLMFTL